MTWNEREIDPQNGWFMPCRWKAIWTSQLSCSTWHPLRMTCHSLLKWRLGERWGWWTDLWKLYDANLRFMINGDIFISFPSLTLNSKHCLYHDNLCIILIINSKLFITHLFTFFTPRNWSWYASWSQSNKKSVIDCWFHSMIRPQSTKSLPCQHYMHSIHARRRHWPGPLFTTAWTHGKSISFMRRCSILCVWHHFWYGTLWIIKHQTNQFIAAVPPLSRRLGHKQKEGCWGVQSLTAWTASSGIHVPGQAILFWIGDMNLVVSFLLEHGNSH